jgi:hypothetical protein
MVNVRNDAFGDKLPKDIFSSKDIFSRTFHQHDHADGIMTRRAGNPEENLVGSVSGSGASELQYLMQGLLLGAKAHC